MQSLGYERKFHSFELSWSNKKLKKKTSRLEQVRNVEEREFTATIESCPIKTVIHSPT